MTRTKVAIRKRPAPLTDAQIAVLRLHITVLESLLRKHNADLAAHTRAMAKVVEPLRKALDATGKTAAPGQLNLALRKRAAILSTEQWLERNIVEGKTGAAGGQVLAPTKRRSRKQKE